MDNKIFKFCGFGGIHKSHENYLPKISCLTVEELTILSRLIIMWTTFIQNNDQVYHWPIMKVCGECEFLVADAYCCN